jgi:ankyrin repeat protein
MRNPEMETAFTKCDGSESPTVDARYSFAPCIGGPQRELHIAARKGDKETILQLLGDGARIDLRSGYVINSTVVRYLKLFLFVINDLVRIFQPRILHVAYRLWKTALHHAVNEGHKEIVSLLLDRGEILEV